MSEYHVEFGAMCAPIRKQLADQGLSVKDEAELGRIELIAHAVSVVTIHGLMPHSQSDRARAKLAKRLWAIVLTPTTRHLGEAG